MEIIVLNGIQGSGKSTYARQLVEERGFKRVNNDELRLMIDCGKWSKKHEDTIAEVRNSIIETLMELRHDIVVDNMNLHLYHIAEIAKLVEDFEGPIIKRSIVFFNTPLEVCIERDSKREKPIGEKVIRICHGMMLKQRPKIIENLSKYGFEEIENV